MPRKFNKPCSVPGCPNLCEAGQQYCSKHKTRDTVNYNKYSRAPDYTLRYGWRWKKIRDRYAAAHPLCEECLKQGRMTPTEEVHHIVPVNRGGTDEESNLMSLCHSCREKIHHKLGDR